MDDMNILDRLVQNAEAALKDKGWLKSDLVRRVSISKGYVYIIFNKEADPSISSCEAVARGLGMSLAELLTYRPESPTGLDELQDLYIQSSDTGRGTILAVARAQAAFPSEDNTAD